MLSVNTATKNHTVNCIFEVNNTQHNSSITCKSDNTVFNMPVTDSKTIKKNRMNLASVNSELLTFVSNNGMIKEFPHTTLKNNGEVRNKK